MPQDSTGKHVTIGDKVRFRGQVYTVRDFTPHGGCCGTSIVHFVEEQHTKEVADEISIDLVSRGTDPLAFTREETLEQS